MTATFKLVNNNLDYGKIQFEIMFQFRFRSIYFIDKKQENVKLSDNSSAIADKNGHSNAEAFSICGDFFAFFFFVRCQSLSAVRGSTEF